MWDTTAERTYDAVRSCAEGRRPMDHNVERGFCPRKAGWMMGFMDPIQRAANQDGAAYALAGLGAMGAFVSQWAMVVAALLLALASVADYLLGRKLAVLEDRENEELAAIGRVLKVTAFIQVWLLWGVELLVNAVNPWDLSTGGYVAVFACLVLVADELDSLDAHRVKRGARPLFGWRQLRDRIFNPYGRKGNGRDGPPPAV